MCLPLHLSPLVIHQCQIGQKVPGNRETKYVFIICLYHVCGDPTLGSHSMLMHTSLFLFLNFFMQEEQNENASKNRTDQNSRFIVCLLSLVFLLSCSLDNKNWIKYRSSVRSWMSIISRFTLIKTKENSKERIICMITYN